MHENFYFLITCICFMYVHNYLNHQRIKNFTSKGRFFRKKMSLRKTNKQTKPVGVLVKGYSLCLQTVMIDEDSQCLLRHPGYQSVSNICKFCFQNMITVFQCNYECFRSRAFSLPLHLYDHISVFWDACQENLSYAF